MKLNFEYFILPDSSYLEVYFLNGVFYLSFITVIIFGKHLLMKLNENTIVLKRVFWTIRRISPINLSVDSLKMKGQKIINLLG